MSLGPVTLPVAVLVALLSAPPSAGSPSVPGGPTGGGAEVPGSGGLGGASCGPVRPVAAGLEGIPSLPACVGVELAVEASGRPPLLYSWTLPPGAGEPRVLSGNPVVVDTGRLPFGYQEIVLEVSNDAGSSLSLQPLVVERLGFREPPELVVVGGTTVAAVANTRGATEWRWIWGDGTATGWLEGCAGYRPEHTYAAPGVYTVRVKARSCREGPVSTSGMVDVGGGDGLVVERFEAVCAGAPFCSVGVGEVVEFETVVSGAPEAYLYDWDGDGLDDEVSFGAVGGHVYLRPGYFTPMVTVVAGSASDRLAHGAPIEVLAGGGVLFERGFESGDLSGWVVP